MGCSVAVFERQSRNDGRLLRRRNADACRDRASAASRRNLPGGNRQQLSRWMDLSRRGVRAVVRSKLDDPTRDKYAVVTYRKEHQCIGGRAYASAHAISFI